jgi:acyl-CoA thioesterase
MSLVDLSAALDVTWESELRGHVLLTDAWRIGAGINGGLLMALATTTAARWSPGGQEHPIAWSSHFHSAAQEGPTVVLVEPLRAGRSVSAVSVRLLQEETVRVSTLVTLGDLGQLGDRVYTSPTPPPMPSPEQCIRADRSAPSAQEVAILDRIDLRIDPATALWALGQPSGEGRMRSWIRLSDGEVGGVAAVPFFLDAMPPVSFDLGVPGWAPTLEFTGYLRALPPESGWLRLALSASTVVGGLLEEDATLWDDSGRVIAQSRQLAGIRMPQQAPRSGGVA